MNTKLVILFTLFAVSNLLASNDINIFPTDTRYYTIQVKSFPYEELNQALELYQYLKNNKYPVYHQIRNVKNQNFIGIRVGVFKKLDQAQLYAIEFKKKEGFDYFVDFADIFVDNYNHQFYVVSTPQSVYFWDGKNSILLLDKPLEEGARIAPNGKDVVFSNNHQIFKICISNQKVTHLKGENNSTDSLIHPQASWSPDGKHIAYLMYNHWELKTELWVMDHNGDNDRCLIPYDELQQYSVKNYVWHPTENKIFYVFGFAHGTLSVGGNIYITDLKGNHQAIISVDPNKREEIYRFFRIVEDTLYYKKAHFLDDQFMHREYKLYDFSLDMLK